MNLRSTGRAYRLLACLPKNFHRAYNDSCWALAGTDGHSLRRPSAAQPRVRWQPGRYSPIPVTTFGTCPPCADRAVRPCGLRRSGAWYVRRGSGGGEVRLMLRLAKIDTAVYVCGVCRHVPETTSDRRAASLSREDDSGRATCWPSSPSNGQEQLLTVERRSRPAWPSMGRRRGGGSAAASTWDIA